MNVNTFLNFFRARSIAGQLKKRNEDKPDEHHDESKAFCVFEQEISLNSRPGKG